MTATQGSFFMRVAAVLAFLLSIFGVNPGGYPLIALGLAIWCCATLLAQPTPPTASFVLRILAVLAFLLAYFGVSPGGFNMIGSGLALWCGATLVPGPTGQPAP